MKDEEIRDALTDCMLMRCGSCCRKGAEYMCAEAQDVTLPGWLLDVIEARRRKKECSGRS